MASSTTPTLKFVECYRVTEDYTTRTIDILRVCVCLLFISRCMRPEGPWQRLAAALADSSAFYSPLQDQILSPTTLSYTGASLPPTPFIRQTKERMSQEKGKGQKKIYPRVGLAHPPHSPVLGPLPRPCLISSVRGVETGYSCCYT